MMDLTLSPNQLNANGYWTQAIQRPMYPIPDWVGLFDQNGYDLTPIEILYCEVNHDHHSMHRNRTHTALKSEWFHQPIKTHGAVLNHALLFERKGYQGAARDQLITWAHQIPLLWKVIRIRPKWGLDFSMDWADVQGNVFEILHYEFDSFDHEEIMEVKLKLEHKFLNMDWNAAAQELLHRKSEWHHLDFFAQSDYKCAFFGLPSERFKMVTWE
jgi:hypothetical protein